MTTNIIIDALSMGLQHIRRCAPDFAIESLMEAALHSAQQSVRNPSERFLAARDDQEILEILAALPQPAAEVSQAMCDAGAAALIAFRKSGSDWSDKPAHAARVVLEAAIRQPAAANGVPELFVQWLEREMPPGTIIGKPAWWAPKLTRALRNAERGVLGGCNG